MAIKIIGGTARGMLIDVPKGNSVRPTSISLKRRPFDSMQSFSGYTFIDLCAGTGSVGLEALSRGADSVVFVEKSRKHSVVLQANIDRILKPCKSFNEDISVKTVVSDALKWLISYKERYSSFSREEKQNVVIFFDPPYEYHHLYEEVCNLFFSENWYEGDIWIESDNKKGVDISFWDDKGQNSRIYSQGDSYIICFTQ